MKRTGIAIFADERGISGGFLLEKGPIPKSGGAIGAQVPQHRKIMSGHRSRQLAVPLLAILEHIRNLDEIRRARPDENLQKDFIALRVQLVFHRLEHAASKHEKSAH